MDEPEHKCIWVEHTGLLRCCVYEGCAKLEIPETAVSKLEHGTMEDRLVWRMLSKRGQSGKGNT